MAPQSNRYVENNKLHDLVDNRFEYKQVCFIVCIHYYGKELAAESKAFLSTKFVALDAAGEVTDTLEGGDRDIGGKVIPTGLFLTGGVTGKIDGFGLGFGSGCEGGVVGGCRVGSTGCD